ncbi:hypothetical protein brsh051_28980 [Brooklawnia propionicigenes]|uniref:Uncharacterized protein n=1 Tax=Brooklawnia propionicigenes TaxID=3041175 RepID=A0AAN0K858_9ACTN|nr:hypothetical protein [Brooklawnia sp. SH051]BEH03617.1 hypothetical protein brsh051_28980 [Brooklawnia sp. SH051]
MNGAEFCAVRESLGLSKAWLARRLQVSPEAIDSWEQTSSAQVPPAYAADLSFIEALADARATDLLGQFLRDLGVDNLKDVVLDASDPSVWPSTTVPGTDDECETSGLPAGFFRACAYRVRRALSGRLTIEYVQPAQDEYILGASASGIVTLTSNADGGRLVTKLGPVSDPLSMKSAGVKQLVAEILDVDQCQISARRIRSSDTHVLWAIRIGR